MLTGPPPKFYGTRDILRRVHRHGVHLEDELGRSDESRRHDLGERGGRG